jgi:hypothetical protein
MIWYGRCQSDRILRSRPRGGSPAVRTPGAVARSPAISYRKMLGVHAPAQLDLSLPGGPPAHGI